MNGPSFPVDLTVTDLSDLIGLLRLDLRALDGWLPDTTTRIRDLLERLEAARFWAFRALTPAQKVAELARVDRVLAEVSPR